ncbi:MAG TPA: hypothetical protein VEV39_02140 [Gemmatimonadales bacterium]|nr:hypothetical protein [Gemmatimonadales bacterium]
MRLIVIGLLACLWVYFAYTAFKLGNAGEGVLLLLVGAALTFWRLRRMG